ncbi:MAG: hypothetical protein K0S07_1089 [Chlamydiales bacterium]|jgi:hypothetical protein|nr:hypothetical protein [Chlamydiales bacterium]
MYAFDTFISQVKARSGDSNSTQSLEGFEIFSPAPFGMLKDFFSGAKAFFS